MTQRVPRTIPLSSRPLLRSGGSSSSTPTHADQAEVYLREIKAALEDIADNPRLGRPCDSRAWGLFVRRIPTRFFKRRDMAGLLTHGRAAKHRVGASLNPLPCRIKTLITHKVGGKAAIEGRQNANSKALGLGRAASSER